MRRGRVPAPELRAHYLNATMDVPTPHPSSSNCTSSPPPSPASVHTLNRPYAFFIFHRRSLQHRPQLLNVSPLISNQLVRTMADAESSFTDSSLAPSTAPTSLLDSLPHVPHSPVHSDKSDRRASLGLIDAARVRFSKDVSSRSTLLPLPPYILTIYSAVVPNTCCTPVQIPSSSTPSFVQTPSPSASALSSQLRSVPSPSPLRPAVGLF